MLLPAPIINGVVNVIAVDGLALHNTWLPTGFTVAVGLTIIVNVAESPAQVTPPLVMLENTFMVAVTGVVPALVAVNAGMFPVPFAPRPIDGVLFVQV